MYGVGKKMYGASKKGTCKGRFIMFIYLSNHYDEKRKDTYLYEILYDEEEGLLK